MTFSSAKAGLVSVSTPDFSSRPAGPLLPCSAWRAANPCSLHDSSSFDPCQRKYVLPQSSLPRHDFQVNSRIQTCFEFSTRQGLQIQISSLLKKKRTFIPP